MDDLGRRPVLLASGIGNAAALAALTLAPSLDWFLAGVFVLHRVLQIALFTALLTLSADVLPESRRTQGLAIYGLGGLIPLATGGALGDLLLVGGGFDLLFICAALLSVASWLMVWRVPVYPTGEAGGPRRGFWAALRQVNLLPVWWLTMLFAVGLQALFTFIRTFVDKRQVGSVGMFFLIYGGVAIAVRIATSGRLDSSRQIPLISGALGAYAAGFFVIAGAASATRLAVGASLLGLGHGLLFPIISAQVVARARDSERGSAMAIFTSLFDLAVLTAAPAVGAIIDWRGYTAAFNALETFLVAGIAIYILWDRTAMGRQELSGVASESP
jgi:predicted MFS family arabinose efflux permease